MNCKANNKKGITSQEGQEQQNKLSCPAALIQVATASYITKAAQ
jgi:hypothetical protein